MATLSEKPFTFLQEEPPVTDKESSWVPFFNLCEQAFQCPPNEIWLDHFPPEVTVRIAQHLIKICSAIPETRFVSPLQLADTSFRQSLAIKHALKFHVQLEGNDDFAIRLAGLMRDDVRAVDCHKWRGAPDVLLPLLGAPCLKRACVTYRIPYLEELGLGRVSRLRVCGARMFQGKFAFVRMESVKELSVQWADVGKTETLFESLLMNFPNVCELELECDCSYGMDADNDNAIQMLGGFGQLKLLRTNLLLVGSDVPFLKGLDQVEVFCGSLTYSPRGLDFDQDLLTANVLTAIDIRWPLIAHSHGHGVDELQKFEYCKRLVRLQLPLRHGVGADLPYLPVLESLCLTWDKRRKSVYEVPPDFLSRIVHQLPAIKHLEFRCARISLRNGTWLLEKLKGQLESLGVSIEQASREQVAFVKHVMQAVVACNSSLECLRFFPIRSRSGTTARADVVGSEGPRRGPGDNSPNGRMRSEWRRDILWMICVLERCTAVKNGQELRDTFAKWSQWESSLV